MAPAITNQLAKDKICLFFTEEWPQADAAGLDVVKITDGYSNTVHIVRRNNKSVIEPAVVILRHYGGNDFDLTTWVTKNSESEETLIVKEMSDKGWGPTVYGIFAGGRVEEYIDGCSLVPQQLADDRSICLEIARNYARFHSLQLPLQKQKFTTFRKRVSKADPQRRAALEQEVHEKRPDLLSKLALLLDWETTKDKEWLFQIFEKQQFRQGFSIVDPNYLNILLRKDRKKDKSFIVLVDYELAAYGYTALDMGGHLLMRLIKPRDSEDMLSGLEFPSMEEIRDFVTAYSHECQELGTLREQDTIDHLVQESLYGCLMSTIYILEQVHGNMDMISSEIKMISGIAKVGENYHSLKAKIEELDREMRD